MTTATVDQSIALVNELRERIAWDGAEHAYTWLVEQDPSILALALTLMSHE